MTGIQRTVANDIRPLLGRSVIEILPHTYPDLYVNFHLRSADTAREKKELIQWLN